MKPLKKMNLSEAVYQRILTMINEGNLEPGDRIPSESRLSEMLGVSRTAIREGIRALAGINVVTITPGRGTFVNEDPDLMVHDDALNSVLRRETIQDIYEVRSLLEIGIAKYAAMRATKEDIVALEKALIKMESSVQSDPINLMLAMKAHEDFHFALCEATHNTILRKVSWPIINHAMLRPLKKNKFTADLVRKRIGDHTRILEIIKRKDPAAAAEEMERHINAAFETIYTEVQQP
jgi:GntR family transcriptional repressor for pyruvate dehydrogenase complex